MKDTLACSEGKLYKIVMGSSYKIIDVDEDFGTKNRKNRYYFAGIAPEDTIKQVSEPETQYHLRLQQAVIAYIPVGERRINNRLVYTFYVIGECFPISNERCISARITNGQYSIIHFEKEIGMVGFSAGESKCDYILKDESYLDLTRKKNN